MNFVKASLKHKQVTLPVLIMFFAFGIYSLLNMSRREDPKITNRQGLVIAYYPGANSAQVEAQLTGKLEEYLFKFEEVNKAKTTSSSEDGRSVIIVELNENVKESDMFWNKLRHELLVARQIDLPDGVVGPLVNSDFGDTEAMILGISGKNVPYNQLKQYARNLEDQLRTIPSVSKIKRSGDMQEQVLVTTNSARMSQYGVTLQDVMKVLQSQNEVYPTGNIGMDGFQVPLYTNGYYKSQEDLGNQIIGTSKTTGSVVRLKDVAVLTRTYADPTSAIQVNGENAMLVSIQMQAGNNIVTFGDAVNQKLDAFRQTIPANVHLTTITDQPQMVGHNINHFIREFFLAIAAVIIVVLLMLPFRIALVASMAIPMTVSLTLALMNFFGIELHQVSLAALIVVLGMVVDDAIVVADNYVELLDEGVTRWDAAWRSANDLVVPILVATLTIIFSFMPMVLLTGAVGEFIRALPLTVTIALASSFIVAMVLTPLLCFTFIKKGLHDPNASKQQKQHKSLLDRLQLFYNKSLNRCVRHPWLTLTLSLVPVVVAFLLYKYEIKQKFFPEAERNQFVIELWMPTTTHFEETEKAIDKLRGLIRNDKRVVNDAAFIGCSAPRFYYNFAPEVPVPNYGQILINTTDNETTETLAKDLEQKVQDAVPEGYAQVKLMQQGQPMKASVEVRITGDNLIFLKQLGDSVTAIMKNTAGSAFVRNDFKENYFGYNIHLKPEAARLGFTTESIAKTVYAGFSGAPVTTIREGDNPVQVQFRLDSGDRKNTTDLSQVYLSSPVTNASVPLEQVAALNPVWQTGRIMHRNGLRTLTVQCETTDGVLPSQLLSQIRPRIAGLQLPAGYSISYGGEYANQQETLPQMVRVMIISVILIFFILLFQFKHIKEALIIMLTIPLSLFGAMLGLWVTHNNFGFTAFVGLISLSGIVVRNSIILIDHIHELVNKHGMDIRAATIESGKRRLRPIFLTAMAAAIGVLPMILSGSPMWSPLASVIAVGVVWSMVMALVTVPVIYLLWVVPGVEKAQKSDTVVIN